MDETKWESYTSDIDFYLATHKTVPFSLYVLMVTLCSRRKKLAQVYTKERENRECETVVEWPDFSRIVWIIWSHIQRTNWELQILLSFPSLLIFRNGWIIHFCHKLLGIMDNITSFCGIFSWFLGDKTPWALIWSHKY